MKDAIERVHGHRAAMAVLEKRPDDVLRVACTRDHLAAVEHALGKRKTHVGLLSATEVEKLAGSKQSERTSRRAGEAGPRVAASPSVSSRPVIASSPSSPSCSVSRRSSAP